MMETIEEKKRSQKIDQLVDSQGEFVTNVNKLLRNNSPQNNRDRFLVKKDFTFEEQKSQGKKLNQLLKINSEILNENKKRNSGFKTLLKIGAIGGLLGWLLFGKKDDFLKGIKAAFSKETFSGLLDGIFNGNWDRVKENIKNVGDAFGDGLISQILTGKNKPFNTLIGSLKMQGGLFQGLVFGEWDLFKKGFEDLKNNLTMGQVGILGSLLFGVPLAKGAITALGGAATTALIPLLTNPVTLAALATAAGAILMFHKPTQEAYKKLVGDDGKPGEFSKAYNPKLIPEDKKDAPFMEKLWVGGINLSKQLGKLALDIKRDPFGKKLLDMRKTSQFSNDEEDQIRSFTGFSKIFTKEMRDSLIDKYSEQYSDVPKNLVKAIIQQESANKEYPYGKPRAEGKMTKYGTAKGLGQFIDSTAKQYIPGWKSPEDSYDPEKNIAGIFSYMDTLLKQNNGNVEKATGRYFGTGRDPVLNKTTDEYAKEVGKIYGELNQNNAVSKNVKDLKIKIENAFLKPFKIDSDSMEVLATKIAEKTKANVPTINNRQNITVNPRK